MTPQAATYEFALADDLVKIFPDTDVQSLAEPNLVTYRGRSAVFQLAYRFHRQARTPGWPPLRLELSGVSGEITVYQVKLAPAQCPSWRQSATDYVVDTPTLVPDILVELGRGKGAVEAEFKPNHSGWNSLWIEVNPTPQGESGQGGQSSDQTRVEEEKLQLKVSYAHGPTPAYVYSTDDRFSGHGAAQQVGTLLNRELHIDIYPFTVAAAPVKHLRWLHHDCVAQTLGVPAWSEAHWEAVTANIAAAADLGTTALMVPVWTPTLDVAKGAYRRPNQLLGITKTEAGYELDYTNLERWIATARAHGISGVEVPPLFTQWGAATAAAFYIGTEAGAPATDTPYFGWHTPADDPEFKTFLEFIVPAIRAVLEAEFGVENVYWHVSDEPQAGHVQTYTTASQILKPLLEGAVLMDALADPAFLDQVPIPVVATSEVGLFRAANYEPKWVYYCVSQSSGQANQFLAQSAIHHRIQGFQLYKNRVEGFLHWGFNFYNSQYSLAPINPYETTDADGNFISGDPFIVYPAGTAVRPSLRHRMIKAAWLDLALCYFLAERLGRSAVIDLIDPGAELDYDRGYPCAGEYRQRLTRLITKAHEEVRQAAHAA